MKYKMGKKKKSMSRKAIDFIRNYSISVHILCCRHFYFEEIEEQRKKEREKRFDNC